MKKLKLAILGVEHCHMPAYAQAIKHGVSDMFETVAVADCNIDKGEKIANYLGARYYRDYEKLLDKEEIDCVFLEPVVSDHGPMSIAAMEKGLHILCEKPLAQTWEKTKEVLNIYRKINKNNRTIYHIAFALRFANHIMKMRDYADNGYFGKIIGINATNPGNAHVPDYPDWVHNPRYSGGGSIIDHTVHCLDILRWVLKSEVTEVYAEANNKIRKWKVEDAAEISLLFDNGVFSTIEASWVRLPHNPEIFGMTLDIFGTVNSMSIKHYYTEKLTLRQENPDIYTDMEGDGSGRLQLDPMGFFGGAYDRGIFGEFYKAIMGWPNLGADIYDGYKAGEVCFAAYKSIKEGKPVGLPLN